MLYVLPEISDCFLILPPLFLLLQHLHLKVPEANIPNPQTLQSFSLLGIPKHPHTPESCIGDSIHPTAATFSSFLTSGLLPKCLAWIKTHLCGLKLALFTRVPPICKCVCFHTLCSLLQGNCRSSARLLKALHCTWQPPLGMVSELNSRLAFMLKWRSSRSYSVMIFTAFWIAVWQTESQTAQQVVRSVDELLQLLPLNHSVSWIFPKTRSYQACSANSHPSLLNFRSINVQI